MTERDDYMRRQEADHELISHRQPRIRQALPSESRHLALQCRDRAQLLLEMDRHIKPEQSSAGTARLLDQAADEIIRLSGCYISAVKGRQEFRKSYRDLREGIDKMQSLIHNLPRSATADQIDKLASELLGETPAEGGEEC